MTLRDLMARLEEVRGEVGPDAQVVVLDGYEGWLFGAPAVRAEDDAVVIDLTHTTADVE